MLSPDTRTLIRERVAAYPKGKTALLPALKLAQAEVGYLPPEAVAEVADLVGVSHADAQTLVSFYSMLRTEPSGRVRVEVCVQLPCAVAGGERLLRQLAEGLGITPDETTPDGLVSLVRTPECLGACHRAPMCRANTLYVENLKSQEAVERLIEVLRGGDLGPLGTPAMDKEHAA
jgi:NADH-quinone oxidoreductase subunit E